MELDTARQNEHNKQIKNVYICIKFFNCYSFFLFLTKYIIFSDNVVSIMKTFTTVFLIFFFIICIYYVKPHSMSKEGMFLKDN